MKISDYISKVPDENIRKYEDGFNDNLLVLIKTDSVLSHFHVRLVCECENIVKVIEVATPKDIEDLEDIISSLMGAKNIDELALYDSEFHKRLFFIAGEDAFITKWKLQKKNLHNFLKQFWKSIRHGTSHYQELLEIHYKLFQSIKNRDADAAVATMQEHFAVLLFQLLRTVYINQEDT